jgi:predicted dienelactone hydrolase
MFDIEADWWLSDMICALDECVRQNNDAASLLYKKINLLRIGAMGHSLGGSVAIQLCRSDARIKAVINFDGPLYGSHATVPVEKPLLMIVGASSVSQLSLFTGGVPFHKEFLWRYYFNQQSLPALKMLAASSAQAQIVFIDKIVHGSFSDEAFSVDPVIAPFVLNGELAHSIIYAHVKDFFEKYL